MNKTRIITINLILGLLFSLSHVPVVIFRLMGDASFQDFSFIKLAPYLTIDMILVAGSLLAYFSKELTRERVIMVQACALIVLSLMLVAPMLWYLVTSLPDGNFSVSLGYGAAISGYAAYLGKTLFYKGQHKVMLNLGWVVFVATLFIEVLLMYRFFFVHFT
ncbi:hypothetical protein ACWJJH_02495 [Endozoicomonadaceae bacterium StTr2]